MVSEEYKESFLRDFRSLSQIGRTALGGVSREAGTVADGQLKSWLSAWLTTHGFEVRVDAIGNIYGVLEWTEGVPFVMAGSHLDSQPMGGRFDGAYGVLAAAYSALAVKHAVERHEIAPQRNLAVVNWFNEEGSRFKPSMMGSSVYCGLLEIDEALSQIARDDDETVAESLRRIGFLGESSMPAAVAYAEIHIEQGRRLDRSGADIGIVDTTWSAQKYQISVLGEQSHTGATLMEDRRDALYGAALVVTGARDIVAKFAPNAVHSSSGELTVTPNSPVVVPSRVDMHVDVRAEKASDLIEADRMLNEVFAHASELANVEIIIDHAHEWQQAVFHLEGIQLAEQVCDRVGLSHQRIATIAGHDATNLREQVPTVLIFVPSEEGVSHNEREFTKDLDLLNGLSVLEGVLAELVIQA